MGTPRQLTQIAFAAPLDESTEDEVLDPNVGFPVLQNVRQDYRGGISKRLGFDPLTRDRTSGSDRSIGWRCFPHRGNACVIDGSTIDSYSVSQAVNVSGGRVPMASVEVWPLPASCSVLASTQYDVVACNGFVVMVHTTLTASTGVGATGADATIVTADKSTTLIRRDSPIFGFGVGDLAFRLGAFGTTVVLIATTNASANIAMYTLDCTSATTAAAGWTSFGNVATDKKTSTDSLSVQSLSDRVAFAYINNSAGTSQVTVKTVNASGVVETRTINTSSATPDNLAIEGSATLWVVWNETLDVRAIGIASTSLATTVATTATVLTGGGLLSTNPPSIVSSATVPGSAAIIAYNGGDVIRTNTWTTTAGAVTPDVAPGAAPEYRGATLSGRAFERGGRRYGLFYVDTVGSSGGGIQTTTVLADWTSWPFTPTASAAPNLVSTDTGAHTITLNDGRSAYVQAVLTSASIKTFELVVCDFADPERWRYDSHNGVTFLAGGILSYWSGDRIRECNFMHAPRLLDFLTLGGGTGPTGDVNYVVVFEDTDGAGNLSQSGASTPFAYTGTGQQAFFTCDPLLLTWRSTTTRATIYRTLENGTVYYRVDSVPAISDQLLSFNDTYDDATLQTQPRLFGTGTLPGTYGGPLQREAPPYCKDVVSFAGMLVVASGSELWWSGQTIGGEGTWFSTEQFFVPVDGDDNITALAVLDGTLYVFKERAIWIVGGEAPNDNGTAGGLGTPRRLSGDVGCITPNSVVVTSLGIFFQSYRGIELLAGGGRPQWIGEKVLRTLSSYSVVTSAKLDPRNNIVRFTLAAYYTNGLVTEYDPGTPATGEDPEIPPSGGGRDLIFDLVLGDWQSVDDKYGTAEHAPSQDACVITVGTQDIYTWLDPSGTLWLEGGSCTDNGNWIYMTASSGWFKIAGIQGRQLFENMLLLARRHTDLSLSIAIGYDYDPAYETESTWSAATIDTILSKVPRTQLRHDGNNDSEGQAVRIRITDAADGDGISEGGRGATWLALTLNITPQEGPANVPVEAA